MAIQSVREALNQRRVRRKLPPPDQRRKIREAAGVTQAVVARTLRVSKSSISKWESGNRQPSTEGRVRTYLSLLDEMKEAVANDD